MGHLPDWERELDAQVAETLAGLPLFVREILKDHGKCVSDRMAAESGRRQVLKDWGVEMSLAMPRVGPPLDEMHRRRYPWTYEAPDLPQQREPALGRSFDDRAQ